MSSEENCYFMPHTWQVESRVWGKININVSRYAAEEQKVTDKTIVKGAVLQGTIAREVKFYPFKSKSLHLLTRALLIVYILWHPQAATFCEVVSYLDTFLTKPLVFTRQDPEQVLS